MTPYTEKYAPIKSKKKKRNPHAENESFFIVQQTTSRKVETYHFFRHKRNDCLLKDSKTTGHKQKNFRSEDLTGTNFNTFCLKLGLTTYTSIGSNVWVQNKIPKNLDPRRVVWEIFIVLRCNLTHLK